MSVWRAAATCRWAPTACTAACPCSPAVSTSTRPPPSPTPHADVLVQLRVRVDDSLVEVAGDGPPMRHRLLEPVRQCAARLPPGEAGAVRKRHAPPGAHARARPLDAALEPARGPGLAGDPASPRAHREEALAAVGRGGHMERTDWPWAAWRRPWPRTGCTPPTG